MAKIIHCHRYAEIHIVLEGRFVLENETHPFSRGSAFLIPPGVYHCYKNATPKAKLLAFQTDLPAEVFLWRTVSLGVIHEISEVTRPDRFLADRGSLSALLSYVASSFCPAEGLRQTRDDAVLISEFISKNYNRNITVAELAKQLCLSARQTERLVKNIRGILSKKP